MRRRRLTDRGPATRQRLRTSVRRTPPRHLPVPAELSAQLRRQRRGDGAHPSSHHRLDLLHGTRQPGVGCHLRHRPGVTRVRWQAPSTTTRALRMASSRSTARASPISTAWRGAIDSSSPTSGRSRHAQQRLDVERREHRSLREGMAECAADGRQQARRHDGYRPDPDARTAGCGRRPPRWRRQYDDFLEHDVGGSRQRLQQRRPRSPVPVRERLAVSGKCELPRLRI